MLAIARANYCAIEYYFIDVIGIVIIKIILLLHIFVIIIVRLVCTNKVNVNGIPADESLFLVRRTATAY